MPSELVPYFLRQLLEEALSRYFLRDGKPYRWALVSLPSISCKRHLLERCIILSYEKVPLGSEIRTRLRRSPQAQEAEPARHLAPRGGLRKPKVCRRYRDRRQEVGLSARRMIADKLGSYAAARRLAMPAMKHRSCKALNNRAENSRVPLRQRERMMQDFRP